MPLWDNSRFDKEAKTIASTWHTGRTANGASLTELVTKTARDACLNPEQIERLARVANGFAFNALFDAAKTAKEKDRYPDFDVADAKSVIAALYESAAQPVAKTASYAPLSDQFKSVRARPDPLVARNEKVAQERLIDDIEVAVHGPSLMAQYANYKAACEVTKSKMLGAEQRWFDALAGIGKLARQRGWSQDDFECNVLALYGQDALPELNLFRKNAGQDRLVVSTEKAASFQDQHIGEESLSTKLLGDAIRHRTDYTQWKGANEVAQRKFDEVKERVYAGPR